MHAAKISDYRFLKVLSHFVRDHTSTEAARATGLSLNSVHAIYRKLRVFFFEVGLFLDFYAGADPLGYKSENPVQEHRILAFHLARNGVAHGLRSPTSEPPYHFAESCWRYDYHVMMQERPAEAVYAMMQRHLLEAIRLCGPIGAPPRNRVEGLRLALRQADDRIEWLRRNAPGFRDDATRAALSSVIAITDDREE